MVLITNAFQGVRESEAELNNLTQHIWMNHIFPQCCVLFFLEQCKHINNDPCNLTTYHEHSTEEFETIWSQALQTQKLHFLLTLPMVSNKVKLSSETHNT
ncbi:hypothetical protein HS088_TW18G00758 [Tripterygium wilfordii]|uniref:Uncharacterized protein n=1 Tax=Tripterygium wilfordii TaxID=458696 RepID=A0A7J7CD57_TRIWF|nr:hypothetical protein HS088_TW18G00758 [Tripterygium wilfordii]